MKIQSLACSFLFALAAIAPAQNRVFLAGTPTNLLFNLSNTAVAPDAAVGNAFYALMPLSVVQGGGGGFAVFDPSLQMDLTYGPGSWLRCTMVATDWAYISDDACAHLAGPGYAAPQSLLTTDYDYGPYPPCVGTPYQPFPNSTVFAGNSQSYVQGLGNTFTQERWQLRTRGWDTNDLWNGCGASSSGVTPTFSGWLIVRFTYTFV